MNYENIGVVDESLEGLSREAIVRSLLGSFKTWKYIIEMGLHQKSKDPWLQTHDWLACKWGYYGDLDLYLKEYEEKLNDLVTGTKQLIKTEIILAMLVVSRKQAADFRFEHTIQMGG